MRGELYGVMTYGSSQPRDQVLTSGVVRSGPRTISTVTLRRPTRASNVNTSAETRVIEHERSRAQERSSSPGGE